MTLRRADKPIRYRGADCAVYELWFAWGEPAFSDDREFFRPIIETAPFQRALDLLPQAVLQVVRDETDGGLYRLRVITPSPAVTEIDCLPGTLEV